MSYFYITEHKKSILKKTVLFIGVFICLANTQEVFGQDENYAQLWNEFAFTHTYNDKWASQVDIGLTFTSIQHHTSVFGSLAQVYGRAWVHYSPNNKWKFSFFYAYFYNHDVPEIDQRRAPEWRSAMQAIYRMHTGRYILSTRFRIEDRHIYNPDSVFEAVNRLRGQIKFVYPINGLTLTKGVMYAFTSDELFFKTKSKISGPDLFDRNRFTIGGGFAVTDDIQVELSYANEALPRSGHTNIYNAFQVNFAFNNLFSNLQKGIFGQKKTLQAIESAN